MRRASIALAMLGVLLLAVPVAAQTNTIVIEVDGIVRGDPGEIFQVAFVNVDPGMVGWLCTGTAQTANNRCAANRSGALVSALARAPTTKPTWTDMVNHDCSAPLSSHS